MTDFEPLDTFRSSVAAATDHERSARIRRAFRARIATLPADADGRRPFDPPSTGRPAPGLTAALVGLAGVAVLVLTAAGVRWLGADRSTTPALDELAVAAAAQVDRPLTGGQRLYLTERSTDADGRAALESRWLAPDGTGRRQVVPLDPGPHGTAPSVTEHVEPEALRFAGLTYEELRGLPTQPTALVQALRDAGASDGSAAADAHALADVLALPVTPPAVAAAAVQGLGQLGGVPVGPVGDGAGRTGVGVRGTAGDGSSWLVVLDPGTGRARAFEPGDPASAPVPSRLWLDQQITDGTG